MIGEDFRSHVDWPIYLDHLLLNSASYDQAFKHLLDHADFLSLRAHFEQSDTLGMLYCRASMRNKARLLTAGFRPPRDCAFCDMDFSEFDSVLLVLGQLKACGYTLTLNEFLKLEGELWPNSALLLIAGCVSPAITWTHIGRLNASRDKEFLVATLLQIYPQPLGEPMDYFRALARKFDAAGSAESGFVIRNRDGGDLLYALFWAEARHLSVDKAEMRKLFANKLPLFEHHLETCPPLAALFM
jgi:hypothetical protein